MELYLNKTVNGLSPADEISEEALSRFKLGARVKCKITLQRNPEFHKKFFALLNTGFKYWVPGEVSSKHGEPQKNFEQFRTDCIILAGYYDIAIRLNGETRITAKSISFNSMKQEEFEKLYSAVIDVFLQKIFVGYSREDIEKINEAILEFA